MAAPALTFDMIERNLSCRSLTEDERVRRSSPTASFLRFSRSVIEKILLVVETIFVSLAKFAAGAACAPLSIGLDNIIIPLIERFQLLPTTPQTTTELDNLLGLNEVSPIGALLITAVAAPLFEEIALRWFVQEVVLKYCFTKIVARISPENASWADTRMAGIFRIVITSVFFAEAHLPNETPVHVAFQLQAVAAFFGGLVLGAIKESPLGLLGSIGCHAAHNATCVLLTLQE